MDIATKIALMKAELEENKNNPDKSALRFVSADGTPTYDIEIYKKELEQTPTEEKYNELFAKINDWKAITMIKNSARVKLIGYWNELN